jgi:hypothetical protein
MQDQQQQQLQHIQGWQRLRHLLSSSAAAGGISIKMMVCRNSRCADKDAPRPPLCWRWCKRQWLAAHMHGRSCLMTCKQGGGQLQQR